MARKTQKLPSATGQLEPLLKAFALRRLQQDSSVPSNTHKAGKTRAKKSKKG
jgi:hypothetical protein